MKEAVKTLQKWTDSWVIGKTEYMWDGGSDEDLDAIHASIRAVLAAIEIRDEALKAKCERIVEMIEAELLLDGTPDFGDAMWNSALDEAIEIVRGEL